MISDNYPSDFWQNKEALIKIGYKDTPEDPDDKGDRLYHEGIDSELKTPVKKLEKLTKAQIEYLSKRKKCTNFGCRDGLIIVGRKNIHKETRICWVCKGTGEQFK